ncbi:hypothetical protein CTA1_11521 [Colletotrichum tanaceti]|uniref:Uncharacterized protein n=1 Tax=Colletotrichum tanaceti TaxID=1306861 RepID=A0A4U6XPN9_9PEZI|nr:hypothetical protein CTA1_11521 [Colletotrichum tanaceti]
MVGMRRLLSVQLLLSTTWLFAVLLVPVKGQTNHLSKAQIEIVDHDSLVPLRSTLFQHEKLTFGQFLARIQGMKPSTNSVMAQFLQFSALKAPCSDPGGVTPTIDQVAQQLMGLGLNTLLDVTELLEILYEKPTFALFYHATDAYVSPYSKYIKMVDDRFRHYRPAFLDATEEPQPQHVTIWEKNLKLGKDILWRIVKLQEEDRMTHLYTQMQQDADDELLRGLSIPENLIEKYYSTGLALSSTGFYKPSMVQGGKPYPHLNIFKTMENAWNDAKTRRTLFEKGFTSAADLSTWAENLGDYKKIEPQPPYQWSVLNMVQFNHPVAGRHVLADLVQCELLLMLLLEETLFAEQLLPAVRNVDFCRQFR